MKVTRSQRGSIMLVSLLITFILLILGTTMLFSLNSETLMGKQSELTAQATYVAHAGIEHGLYLVEAAPSGSEPVFPAGAVRVFEQGGKIFEYLITKNGSQIDSIGRITENGSIKKEITIKAAWDESGQVTIIR